MLPRLTAVISRYIQISHPYVVHTLMSYDSYSSNQEISLQLPEEKSSHNFTGKKMVSV